MSRRLSRIILWADILFVILFVISRWKMTITLDGDESITVPIGHVFVDPGATASLTGKDISAFDRTFPVMTEDEIDTSIPGTYTVSYHASRLFYKASASRTVNVVDDAPPVIVLHDVKTILEAGDVWSDSFEAYDDRDGDLTGQVSVSGSVDTSIVGLYPLRYTVTDSAGNTCQIERQVRVMSVSQPVTGPKIVFLTFDDGPWSHTDELLDILARHNVKATFFITGNHPENVDCIGRAFSEGHTVAVHSYSHNFERVYQSSEAYWADFDEANDLIEEQTGYRANIFRFPGGASNTISSFNQGIMSRLVEQAGAMGYDYFDWNVDSGDGGGVDDPAQIFINVTSGIEQNDVSVVLCHDTHGTTVAAIDDILTWGEENGYTFLPLGKGMTTCHHGVNN